MILVLFRPRRGPLPLAGLGWATLPVLEKNHRYLAIEMDGWRLIHDPLNPFYYPETKKNKNTQGFPMTPRVSHTHRERCSPRGSVGPTAPTPGSRHRPAKRNGGSTVRSDERSQKPLVSTNGRICFERTKPLYISPNPCRSARWSQSSSNLRSKALKAVELVAQVQNPHSLASRPDDSDPSGSLLQRAKACCRLHVCDSFVAIERDSIS